MKSVPRAGCWAQLTLEQQGRSEGRRRLQCRNDMWQYPQPVMSCGNHLATDAGNETIAWHGRDATTESGAGVNGSVAAELTASGQGVDSSPVWREPPVATGGERS